MEILNCSCENMGYPSYVLNIYAENLQYETITDANGNHANTNAYFIEDLREKQEDTKFVVPY